MLQKTSIFSKLSWSRVLLIIPVFALFIMLSGCIQLLQPEKLVGENEEKALAVWGNPTARIAMPDGGQRLQYSGQPWGRYVWNIDLDAQGTVTQVYQALQGTYFYQIPVDGSWGAEDVLREFGRPAFVDRVWSWQGGVWNYRWEEVKYMFYHIYFDENGRVRRADASMDTEADKYDWSK